MGKGQVFVASIFVGALLVTHCPSARADVGLGCGFTPTGAIIEGQSQQFQTSGGPLGPCTTSVTGTVGGTTLLPTVSSVNAGASVLSGFIGIDEKAQGNAEIDIGAFETEEVTSFVPSSLLTLINPLATSVQLGAVTYNLSSIGLFIHGTASATVTNRDQATGIYIDEQASASIDGTSESNSTEIGPCGGTTLLCPGINKNWGLTLSVADLQVPYIDFTFSLSERMTLNTIAVSANGPVVEVNANDPFDITGMALVDANGQVLPGITFTDGDGFTFPSDPSLGTLPGSTPVPEPASIVILGTGLAGLGVLGRRRRKNSGVAGDTPLPFAVVPGTGGA
jgi:hypothetical protein